MFRRLHDPVPDSGSTDGERTCTVMKCLVLFQLSLSTADLRRKSVIAVEKPSRLLLIPPLSLRSPAVASSPGVSNTASVEAARKEVDKLTEEIAILKVKKAEFLPILMIDDAALEDCLCRMMKSPRAVQFLEELGVETPADLKELDEALLRQLALLLKVVPKNRLLRLFGLQP